MSVRVRIAPSPTGNLHIGTARTALYNWLYARHCGGQFILRVEDTDRARSKPEFTENIKTGLEWLGLTWDEGPFFQTDRLHLYQAAVQTLLDNGLAYKCYCTEAELTEMRDKQAALKQAPRYDNRHRNLTPEQQAAFEAEGRKPVIRFKIDDDRVVSWQDRVRGQVTWKGSDLGGDMVVARRSETEEPYGAALYNLAVVVDDLDMNMTHVIRGEDHIANTAKQILLYEALGGNAPGFAHTPLILNEKGAKLSKRDGVTSIDDFKNLGFLPQALANYMLLLGWTPPDSTQELFALDEAAKLFEIDRVSKAGSKFDWDKLDWINSQYLHHMAPEQLVEQLVPRWQEAGYAVDLDGDRPWLEGIAALIAPSLTRLADAAPQATLFFKEYELLEDGRKQLEQEGAIEIVKGAIAALEVQPQRDEASLKEMFGQIAKDLGVKKGMVMKTLRAGLTGCLKGHDLTQAWLLLNQKGLDKARLEAATSALA